MLVIGDPVSSRELLKRMEKNQNNGNQSIKMAFPYDKDKESYTRLQAYTIRQTLFDEQITDLVISIPAVAIHKISEFLAHWMICRSTSRMSGFLDLSFADTKVEDFFGIPMLDLRAVALTEFDQLIKRMFDIVFTLLAMVFILP